MNVGPVAMDDEARRPIRPRLDADHEQRERSEAPVPGEKKHEQQHPDDDRDHEPSCERRARPGEIDERRRPVPSEPRAHVLIPRSEPTDLQEDLLSRGSRARPSTPRATHIRARIATRKTRTGCSRPTAPAKRSASPPAAGSSSGAPLGASARGGWPRAQGRLHRNGHRGSNVLDCCRCVRFHLPRLPPVHHG